WDSTTAPSSGHWVLNGVATQANVAIEVTESELADMSFQAGHGSDDLWVRASDGQTWSKWVEFHVSEPAPAVTATTPVVTATVSDLHTLPDQTFEAANLFTASDADGDAITKYAFWDTQGHGYFTVNGVSQATNAEIDVDAAHLSDVGYV